LLAAARHVAQARFTGCLREGEAPLLFDFSTCILFAQDDPQQPGFFPPMILVSVVGIMFLYMFLVQRPNLKREQVARDNLLKNLKKNDRIVTSGGIYGVVTNVQLDADEITIRVDETTSTKIKITRSAVQRVVSSDSGGKET
jgi:preprotein translocase subunit YajC